MAVIERGRQDRQLVPLQILYLEHGWVVLLVDKVRREVASAEALVLHRESAERNDRNQCVGLEAQLLHVVGGAGWTWGMR